MLILALESSAKAASAAVARDGTLLDLEFQNSGLTHSRTLLPMAEEALRQSGLTLRDIDAVAVARGQRRPGANHFEVDVPGGRLQVDFLWDGHRATKVVLSGPTHRH